MSVQNGKVLVLEEPELKFWYKEWQRYVLETRTVPVPKCIYSESALVLEELR